MSRHHLWTFAVVAMGLTCGCEKKERSVDISPARPAEPTTEVRNSERAQQEETTRAAEAERNRAINMDTKREKVDESAAHGSVTPHTAVLLVTESRCSREARCKNIGAKHKYATMAECTTKLAEEKSDDLNFKDCPRGIDKKELDECVTAIKKEDCNNPLDSLNRLTACRSSDLCLSSK
jgi:hypothetical protein